jgi:5-formyltetrahydrofolate cyclo-ligase
MPDIAEDKRRLRRLMTASRGALDPAARAIAARALHDHLIAARRWPASAVVAGYWPMAAEVDIRPVLATLAAAGLGCVLPVVVGRGEPLVFRAWAPGDPLEPGGFGTSVPSPASRVATPTVLLVPLLAFDPRGFRLGYGGGYYDRTIAGLRATGGQVVAIGVAYARQELEAVPVEAFDQRLDGVVTELGYRAFGGDA